MVLHGTTQCTTVLSKRSSKEMQMVNMSNYVNMFSSSKVAIATALSHHPAWEAMKECIEEYLDEYNSVVLSVSSNQLE